MATETQQSLFLEKLVRDYPIVHLVNFGIEHESLDLSKYPAIDLKTTYEFDSKPEGGIFRTISTRTKPAIHPDVLDIVKGKDDWALDRWRRDQYQPIVTLLHGYRILGGIPDIGHLRTPDSPNRLMLDNPAVKIPISALRESLEYLSVIYGFGRLYHQAVLDDIKLEEGIEVLTQKCVDAAHEVALESLLSHEDSDPPLVDADYMPQLSEGEISRRAIEMGEIF
jgi:hypothetical protein